MSAPENKSASIPDRRALLYDIANVIHSTLDPQEALQSIVTEAVALVKASSGSVALVNPNTGFLEILAFSGLPARAAELKLKLGEGITGWVAAHGRPARVGDVSQDARYIMLRPEVRSELAVPLEVEGVVRAVLNVDSDRPDAFQAGDEELLLALAVPAARVIHNSWLYEQLRLRAGWFEALAGVSRTINSTLNLDDALQAVTRETCRLMRARMCSLMLLDDTREWLDLKASFGAGPDYQDKPRLSASESLLGIVVRRKKAMQIENVQTSARYQNIEVARREGLVSLLSVPLLFSGEAIGTLSVYTAEPYKFSNDEVRVLSALAELSAIAIEKARLYERVVDVEEQLRHNEKLSALGLLAAEVAHEIRNPLTVMKMLYHSLDLKFSAGDPRARDAEVISDKINLLNRIVEQILDFARTSEPAFAPVDLKKLVEELGLLVRHKLRQQNVELVIEAEPSLPLIQGDATQLEQAFLNLALNASESMPSGGTLRIALQTERSRGIGRTPATAPRVVITFTDTGAGMSPEQCRRAFSSVLRTTKSKGTGLGLAIVKRVTEAHHGEVQIQSKVGQGTIVRLVLPAGP